MLLSKQVCRHSTNEMSLQLLSHPVTMATSSSEKILDFQIKRAIYLKISVSSKLMMVILQLKELPRFSHSSQLRLTHKKSFALSLKNIYLHSVSNFIDFLDKHISFKGVSVCMYLCAQTCRLIAINIMTNVTALENFHWYIFLSVCYYIWLERIIKEINNVVRSEWHSYYYLRYLIWTFKVTIKSYF